MNSNFKEIFHSNSSEEKLKEAIHKTKVKKEPRPDNIFPEFIHNLGPKAMKILTTIYNKVWSSKDNLPDEWKKAIIVPILKPANLRSSYRPIALTSKLAKIQERMVPQKSKLTYHGTSQFPTKQIYNIPADKTYTGDKKGLQPTRKCYGSFCRLQRSL